VKIHLSLTPGKAGAHADKHNLVREWMPARLWRIYDLRGGDVEMDFFGSLLMFSNDPPPYFNSNKIVGCKG